MQFKSKKIFILHVLLLGLSLLVLSGCWRREIPNYEEPLTINFATGNSLTTLTYNTGTPLTLPDGSYYTNGQLKPVWQYISNKLDLNLTDVSTAGQTAPNMIEVNAATNFNSATIYGGGVAESFMYYGAKGAFVNLNDYKTELADFYKYLEKYPSIATSITAYDGGIYHIPYIAETDEFSRVFFGRTTWIEALLDSTDNILPETKTLNVSYQGYWKGQNERNQSNVIQLQNEKASNGILKSEDAISVLKNYIMATYPGLVKPSELYIGENAQYDIDELVALWRCVRLSPKTLTKLVTGTVIESCEIIPYFFRTKNQREDIFKLINYFGGTRVYGTNTSTGKWYIDEDNNLQYTFMQDELFEGVEYLKQIFSEGLINPDYDDLNNSANFRTILYGNDKSVDKHGNPTVRQLGFMTFDFIPSTSSSSASEDVEAMLPPVTTLEGMHDNKFYHYIEIPRTVMINGWAISKLASENQIKKALKLFNYLFTEEGSDVQNFGIPNVTADFTNHYTTLKGDKVPKISDWLVENADKYSSSDVASFGSNYLGIRLAVGYKADIGFELQYMNASAIKSYELYRNVMTLGYNKPSKLLELSSPCYSLTKQEKSVLNTISIGDFQMDLKFNYIKGSSNSVKNVAEIKQSYIDNGVSQFIEIYQTAYDRVKNIN